MNLANKVTLMIDNLSGGGAQKVCVSVANGLVELGWEVDLIILNNNNTTYYDFLSKEINLKKLNVKHSRYSILLLLKYIFQEKPKLFLIFNYEFTVILNMLKSIFKFKFKILSRNINTFSEKQKELKNKNFWSKRVVVSLVNWFYFKSDYIINQCFSMQNDLIKVYPNIKSKTSVIYNPVAKNIIDYLGRQDLSKIRKKNYLLCVGRLEKQKGFHYAIKSFANIVEKFPDLRLKILGVGSLEKELKKKTSELGIENRVDFEGFQKDIISYYLYARATLLTSLYEGFPNCIIESISMGTPVVAFDCPSGPSEIIKNGINGYIVRHKDANDLNDKVFSVLSGKFDIEKMSFTVKKHHPDIVMEYYDKILKQFIF